MFTVVGTELVCPAKGNRTRLPSRKYRTRLPAAQSNNHFYNLLGGVWSKYAQLLTSMQKILHKCPINCLYTVKLYIDSSLWLHKTSKTLARSCLQDETPIYLSTVLRIKSSFGTSVATFGSSSLVHHNQTPPEYSIRLCLHIIMDLQVT